MKIPQPNSQDCFACGLDNPYGLQVRVEQIGPDEVLAEYAIPDRFQGYPGVAHGGIVATILDEVTSRALIGPDPLQPRFMYTARLTVHYRRIVPTGVPLRFVGRAVKRKSRTGRATGTVTSPDGQVLVEAEAILVDVPNDLFDGDNFEALGWKIYPESYQSPRLPQPQPPEVGENNPGSA